MDRGLPAPPTPEQHVPIIGLEPEPEPEVPTPHDIQTEALEALQRTRQEGNSAGLVVLATGLGKTWRSSRFDEEALTSAVATAKRAENALEQYRQHAGERTLGFCCSIRHAKFMAEFFMKRGIEAAAVHSGSDSAPRTASLEKLEKGELQVVFAVDLFNEGVDLPQVDTILMLRPTESSIVWTQQFGRGLRTAENKERLNVIDYIGNHRIFLVKIRALLEPLLGQLRDDGSWFGFVQTMGDLDAQEEAVLRETSDFLGDLEVTPMTKSYKMLVLLAMLNRDAFPGEIGIDDLTREFRRLAERSAQLRADVGDPIETDPKLRGHIERNPIHAWTGGRGTGRRRWFEYVDGVFRTTFDPAGEQRPAFQALVRELVEWRLAEYLDRNKSAPDPGGFVARIGHAGGRPIIFLLVTLEKDDMQAGHRYTEHFESGDTFVWQSQYQTKQDSKHGRLLKNHRATGDTVHLFVRKTKKRGNRAAPFVYCGPVDFESWKGEQPITVRWRLTQSVPESIAERA